MMSDPYLEAAIKAGQRAAFINNGDLSYATEVKEIVKAWIGDRTLYQIDPRQMQRLRATHWMALESMISDGVLVEVTDGD